LLSAQSELNTCDTTTHFQHNETFFNFLDVAIVFRRQRLHFIVEFFLWLQQPRRITHNLLCSVEKYETGHSQVLASRRQLSRMESGWRIFLACIIFPHNLTKNVDKQRLRNCAEHFGYMQETVFLEETVFCSVLEFFKDCSLWIVTFNLKVYFGRVTFLPLAFLSKFCNALLLFQVGLQNH